MLCVAIAVLAVACGPPGPKTYDEAKSRACLIGQQVRVGPAPASDFIASTALGGAFRASWRGNSVTVSFGSNPTNAQGLDDAYRNAHTLNVGIDDVLRMQGNAVMLWHQHPTDAEIASITGCLK